MKTIEDKCVQFNPTRGRDKGLMSIGHARICVVRSISRNSDIFIGPNGRSLDRRETVFGIARISHHPPAAAPYVAPWTASEPPIRSSLCRKHSSGRIGVSSLPGHDLRHLATASGETCGFASDSVATIERIRRHSGGIPEVSSLTGYSEMRISRLRSGRRWREDQ